MKVPFRIIFKDRSILLIEKIANIVVQPFSDSTKKNLTSLIEDSLKTKVYPCHRLDKETSGLIIYSFTKEAQNSIMLQFKRHSIDKRYIAFIQGRLTPLKGKLEGMIIDKEGERFGEKYKFAKTYYKVILHHDNFSIVELQPITGRRNQLRIQLANIKHPVIGERKYAYAKDYPLKFRRLALHSYYIKFKHPYSKKNMEFKIDLPEDMKEFLRKHTVNFSLL